MSFAGASSRLLELVVTQVSAGVPLGKGLSDSPSNPGGASLPTTEISDSLRKGVADTFADPTLQQRALSWLTELNSAGKASRLDLLNNYAWVLVVSFVVALCVTPIMRRLAVANGVIDRPSDPRKVHRQPIAYLGGAAVFCGIMAGILFSFVGTAMPSLMNFHPSKFADELGAHATVPWSILLGMTVIAVIGLIDDVVGISPRTKIAGQLFAAAALAVDNVGVQVAKGVLQPIGSLFGNPDFVFNIPLGFEVNFTMPLVGQGVHFNHIPIDVVYWAGTAIIALAVLGACNASNLIDGLDGLLTGTTAICTGGLLIVALGLAVIDDGPRDAQRIVLCMAVLGACLGFLPHNFNPATIFLGDCGSLLLGYMTIVIVLTLGDTGKTHLVFAGLVIYSIPLIDTALAIVRRKLAGKSISAADSDHLHHMLKRALGVKGAVMVLYAMGVGFAGLGVWISLGRARMVYLLALVLISYIGVTAIKIARRKHIEEQAAAYDARRAAGLGTGHTPVAEAATASSVEPAQGEASTGQASVTAR